MNNVLDRIEAIWTGKAKPVKQPLAFDAYMEKEKDEAYRLMEEEKCYRIGFCYHWVVYCAPERLPEMVKKVKDTVRHILYGQFLDDLYALQRAIIEEDKGAAVSLIQKILADVRG